jgi:hypothetical protein
VRTTAYVALEQLPEKHQPRAHMDDIKKLLDNGRQPDAVSLHLAQAKCRLFPERDLARDLSGLRHQRRLRALAAGH